MLSRVADSLHWMSRYIERAENLARIVDVNIQLMLDVPSRQARTLMRDWFPIVACLGEEESFRARHQKSDSSTVINFLVFDPGHPNSILSCLRAARENARTVREHISTEMWEQINRTYLWIISKAARQAFDRNQYEFLQRTKKSLQLFQGITDTTMIHEEGWEFIQIAKHLERADKTTRLLDDEFHILRQNQSSPNDLLLQWLAVLRSCSARHSYQRIYASAVHPTRVAELLLLNEALPRSVEFCVLNLDQCLRRVSGVAPGRFTNRAEKLSGRLLSTLTFSTIEDICPAGLHEAVDRLQLCLNQIGEAIFDAYIQPALPALPETKESPQPVQE